MRDLLLQLWPFLVTGFDLVISLTAAAHVVLYKRNTRSAIAWVGIIWLAPILGTLLYIGLGVNRIHRRAQKIWRHQERSHAGSQLEGCDSQTLERVLGPAGQHLLSLVTFVEDVSKQPLVAGNRVQSLFNGEEAYVAMLAQIDAAKRSVTLCTYIFDNDHAGGLFIAALSRAVKRGVAVRVLIDGVGKRYSFPSVVRKLRRAGVTTATFLPTLTPWLLPYMNLRNHRKILVVDGEVGFTGGMNIRAGHQLKQKPRYAVQDLHFRLQGPVVAQLQGVFAIDWEFATDEQLTGELWFSTPVPVGPVLARGIADGPDDDFDRLAMTILGAVGCAKRSVVVMTPYFLPTETIVSALNVAAMRGVHVQIVLPQENNLRLVKWASMAMLWQVLECGCRIFQSPPPFSHCKLMLVDGVWTMLGSANWDPRSLRLNFEFNVECYDADLATRLGEWAAGIIARSHELTLAEVDARPILVRLRDGVARLATPYL